MRAGWLGSFVAVALLAACGDDEDPSGAHDLWDRFHVADYRTWERPPDYPTRKPSFTSHERAVEIFLNDTLARASREPGRNDWPVGSILVKESYEDDDLVVIAAMEKRPSGWFFAEWKRNGRVLFSGPPEVCTDCHDRSKTDHTWSVKLVR